MIAPVPVYCFSITFNPRLSINNGVFGNQTSFNRRLSFKMACSATAYTALNLGKHHRVFLSQLCIADRSKAEVSLWF